MGDDLHRDCSPSLSAPPPPPPPPAPPPLLWSTGFSILASSSEHAMARNTVSFTLPWFWPNRYRKSRRSPNWARMEARMCRATEGAEPGTELFKLSFFCQPKNPDIMTLNEGYQITMNNSYQSQKYSPGITLFPWLERAHSINFILVLRAGV